MIEYVSPSTIRKQYQVSFTSLRNWANEGKIQYIETPGGNRKYRYNDLVTLLGQPEKEIPVKERKVILYARVSSQKQAKDGDLQRQVDTLEAKFKEKFPQTKYIIKKDVGSGINWKRKGFVFLLDEIHQGHISKVVISDKDRLCRFAFELVQYIFKQNGIEILVLNANNEIGELEESNKRTELSEDLLAIVNVFVAQANGYRSARNRKLTGRGRGRAKTILQNEESEDLSDSSSSSDSSESDGDSEVDV